jgi:hypothetical protein
MRRPLNCPQCKNGTVLRARPQSPREHVAALVFVSPFHCPFCSHRFLASRLGFNHAQHPIDRREHLRIPVRLYLSFSGGKVRGEGTVMDLSVGGCVIKSKTQVHTDDIFYLQLTLDESEPPLEVAAMVRSVSARGIAFKFLRAAQENKRLMAFVQIQTSLHPDRAPLNLGIAS